MHVLNYYFSCWGAFFTDGVLQKLEIKYKVETHHLQWHTQEHQCIATAECK